MTLQLTATSLQENIGADLGTSEWLLIDQAMINSFADTTFDQQFIHVDPERAKQTPFGSTIAHGFLSLSLLSHLLSKDCGVEIENTVMAINYGFDKVRFLQPVTVNSRIRAAGKLIDVTEKAPGQIMVKQGINIEIEGQKKPALMAEWLLLFFVK